MSMTFYDPFQKIMTSRSPRMDPKGIAQELLGPISPLRQEVAGVEDHVPQDRSACWEQDQYSILHIYALHMPHV